MTHICVSELTIIGSDNGLSPGRRQAILWNNAGFIVNWTLRNKLQWNFNRNPNIFNQENAHEHVFCEMASILCQLQCDNRYTNLENRISDMYPFIWTRTLQNHSRWDCLQGIIRMIDNIRYNDTYWKRIGNHCLQAVRYFHAFFWGHIWVCLEIYWRELDKQVWTNIQVSSLFKITNNPVNQVIALSNHR